MIRGAMRMQAQEGELFMLKQLPGSTVEVDISRPGAADSILTSMFLTGGLMLSQVAQFTGLEPYTIQNWVKRGFLSPPQNKKYSRRQLCRILIINMLRDILQLDKICSLLTYINGHLDEESDDTIDDAQLYLYIAELAARLEARHMERTDDLEALCADVLRDYQEPYAGARARVLLVLKVVVTAYIASSFRQRAELLLKQMDE